MATVVTKTIYPAGGGDYSSLAAANTARARNLITVDEAEVWQCGIGNVGVVSLSAAWAGDSTRSLTIKGISTSGLPNDTSSNSYISSSSPISIAVPSSGFTTSSTLNIKIERIYFILSSAAGGLGAGIAEFPGIVFHFDRCYFKCTHTSMYSILDCPSQAKLICTANIFCSHLTSRPSSDGTTAIPIYCSSTSSIKIYNCTFYGFCRAINCSSLNGNTVDVRNCITDTCLLGYKHALDSYGYPAVDYDVASTCNFSDNADDEIPGSSSILGSSLAFKDKANGDFRLIGSESDVISSGSNLTSLSLFTKDIENETFPSSGSWSVGADFYYIDYFPQLQCSIELDSFSEVYNLTLSKEELSAEFWLEEYADINVVTKKVNIKNINPAGGGDYTSLSAANTARARDLTTNNEIEIWNCYGGSLGTFTSGTSWVGTYKNYLYIRAVDSARHAGVYNTAKAYTSAVMTFNTTSSMSFFVEGLQVTVAGTCMTASTNYSAVSVNGMLIRYTGTSSTAVVMSNLRDITNSIIYNNSTTKYAYGIGRTSATTGSGATFTLCNTICGFARGISRSAGSCYINGNVIYNCTTPLSGTATGSYNVVSSGSAIGTNGKVATPTFINAASYDFHLSTSDTGAKNYIPAGTFDSWADPVNTVYDKLFFVYDIDNVQRLVNSAWCAGADQLSNSVTFVVNSTHLMSIDGIIHGLLHLASLSTLQIDAVSTIRFLRLLEAAISNQNALNAYINAGYRLLLPIVNSNIISVTITKLINYLIISNIHTNNITYIFSLISKLLTSISNSITIDTTLKLKTELQAALANNNLTLAALIVLQFLASNIYLSSSSNSRLTSLMSRLSVEQELNVEAILEFTDLLMTLPEFQFTLEEMVEFERLIRKYRGGVVTEVNDAAAPTTAIPVSINSGSSNYIVIQDAVDPEGTIVI